MTSKRYYTKLPTSLSDPLFLENPIYTKFTQQTKIEKSQNWVRKDGIWDDEKDSLRFNQ